MRTKHSQPPVSWQKRIGLCPDDGWQSVLTKVRPPRLPQTQSTKPAARNLESQDGRVTTPSGPSPHFNTHECDDSFDCHPHRRNEGPDSQEDPDFGARNCGGEDAYLNTDDSAWS